MGTIPKPNRKSHPLLTDDPTANRQLIFLLNYMSRYRDIQRHGKKMINYKAMKIGDIWTLGGAGPFGGFFYSEEKHLCTDLHSCNSLMYLPQMKTARKLLPTQSNGYNCGVLVVVTVMDIVMTQWDKQWMFRDFLKSSNGSATSTDWINHL